MGTRRQAYLLLLGLGLVWGGHWAVTKIGLRDIPPFTYGALRVATGLVTLAGLLAARGRLRRPPRSDLPVVLSVGLGQVAAGIALMNLALQVVPAGRSSVLVYTMPLWVAGALLVLAYSGPLATGFGFWATQSITRALSPIETTMGFLVVPVVGLVAGTLLLGEPLGLVDVVGFGITIGAIAVVSLSPGLTRV